MTILREFPRNQQFEPTYTEPQGASAQSPDMTPDATILTFPDRIGEVAAEYDLSPIDKPVLDTLMHQKLSNEILGYKKEIAQLDELVTANRIKRARLDCQEAINRETESDLAPFGYKRAELDADTVMLTEVTPVDDDNDKYKLELELLEFFWQIDEKQDAVRKAVHLQEEIEEVLVARS